MQLSADLGVW